MPAPPRMGRRRSVALLMLDQSREPRLEDVLTYVNPPSEDAAFQLMEEVVQRVITETHQCVLEEIARRCAAERVVVGLTRALRMTSDFLARDDGECGLNRKDLEDDEAAPCEIDARARGRIYTKGQMFSSNGYRARQAVGLPMDDDYGSLYEPSEQVSCESSSDGGSVGRAQRASERGGGVSGDGLDGILSPSVVNVAKARGFQSLAGLGGEGVMLRRGPSMVSVRSESSMRRPGSAAASIARSGIDPAVGVLFEMADRRNAGWLSVADLQTFLGYHGHKKWANATRIRNALVELGISKGGGNEPVMPHPFSRFLRHMVQEDPWMEFSARPLPTDELGIGVPEQARELAAILKEIASQRAKPAAARRRVNRALTSSAGGGMLGHNAGGTHGQGGAPSGNNAGGSSHCVGGGAGDAGITEGFSEKLGRGGQDGFCHQVSPKVSVRDIVTKHRLSSAPASSNQRQRSETLRFGHPPSSGAGGRGGSGCDGAGTPPVGSGNTALSAFLSLDHTVQGSLVEADDMTLKPGVTVQEKGFQSTQKGVSKDSGNRDMGNGRRPTTAEILKARSGPAELQVPGRLSRSAYKALSGTRTAPDLPVGLFNGNPEGYRNPLGDGTQIAPPSRGRERGDSIKGKRRSTAPVALHGYFADSNKDGPDPRLSGGTKVSNGVEGGSVQSLTGGNTNRKMSVCTNASELPRIGVQSGEADPDGFPPLFAGEDVGGSAVLENASDGKEAPLIRPKSSRRPGTSADGASRARVSSPGLGAKGGKRGGREVAAW